MSSISSRQNILLPILFILCAEFIHLLHLPLWIVQRIKYNQTPVRLVESVLIREVSLFQGLKSTQTWYILGGTKCPGVLIEGCSTILARPSIGARRPWGTLLLPHKNAIIVNSPLTLFHKCFDNHMARYSV